MIQDVSHSLARRMDIKWQRMQGHPGIGLSFSEHYTIIYSILLTNIYKSRDIYMYFFDKIKKCSSNLIVKVSLTYD